MELHREVKASDRLPEKPDWYYIVQDYENKLTPYMSWWTGKDWKEFGVKYWLEPIEITEEYKPTDKRPGQVYENAYNDGWNDATKAILSKLKGE